MAIVRLPSLIAAAVALLGIVACGGSPKPAANDEGDSDAISPRLQVAPKTPKVKKLPSDVQEAVDLGLAYLKKQNYVGHDRVGATALVGLTFLECRVPDDAAEIQKITAAIRERSGDLDCPYDIGPVILFLDRLYRNKEPPAEDLKLIRTLALRMVAGQNAKEKLWRYKVPVLDDAAEKKLLNQLGGKWSPSYDGEHDLSCSQFAALGLWAAKRHKVPVEASLLAAARSIRKHQEGNGSWGYQFGNGDSEAMTYCGLIFLAIGRAIADDKGPPVQDAAVAKGLTFLAERLKNKSHTELPYCLWTMERTALILNLDRIGEFDWHSWGTEQLLPTQQKRGSWDGRWDLTADTCFALLFLVRANLFQDLTDKLQGVWLMPGGGDLAMHAGPPRRQEGTQ